jgi:hypothetical protein
MPQDSVRSEPVAEWRAAFGGCRSILEALAKASDDDGRAAARMWWVACMGAQLNACRSKHNEWKEQAAAELPKQLQAEHTERAVMLPGFEPLAQCILDRGAAIGVNPAVTLDHVENEGGRQFAASDWKRAVGEVEPLAIDEPVAVPLAVLLAVLVAVRLLEALPLPSPHATSRKTKILPSIELQRS